MFKYDATTTCFKNLTSDLNIELILCPFSYMYAVVDIETTGGYAGSHRITEIAIVQHDGTSITAEYQTLINPDRNIPSFITNLTGITNEMVSEAPRFEEVADEILGRLEGKIFVAHNAQFDFGFLKREFEGCGIAWTPKRLCTVRLGRKIVPGLKSYSLGILAQHLGIGIENRHRAMGDALATAKIFSSLLRRDQTGEIEKSLKRNSGEMVLPPHLDRSVVEGLPDETGVYYFHDHHGKIIYVGKAKSIKKRIYSHFSGTASEWNRTKVRNEIHHISCELTGTELIALVHEAQEIRRLWPRYNLAQKELYEVWGIHSYEDRNGFLRFTIGTTKKGTEPHACATSKGEAWNMMWEKVQAYELCPRLCGLQKTSGACSNVASGECHGACAGKEHTDQYNSRMKMAIESFFENRESFFIVDKGRKRGERSLVVFDNGKFYGFGFISSRVKIQSISSAKQLITPGRENRIADQLVRNWAENPSSGKIHFD